MHDLSLKFNCSKTKEPVMTKSVTRDNYVISLGKPCNTMQVQNIQPHLSPIKESYEHAPASVFITAEKFRIVSQATISYHISR